MLIFKDAISDDKDEILTDAYPYKMVDDCLYVVKGKLTTETTEVSDSMFGGNASAEGAGDDEGGENASQSGINIVIANRLVETSLGKKDYMVYIKGYMKKVKAKLEAEDPDQVQVFMKGAEKFVKSVLSDFKEWQFFQGESMNPDGMLILVKWDDETPNLYYFKHGLDEEKV